MLTGTLVLSLESGPLPCRNTHPALPHPAQRYPTHHHRIPLPGRP